MPIATDLTSHSHNHFVPDLSHDLPFISLIFACQALLLTPTTGWHRQPPRCRCLMPTTLKPLAIFHQHCILIHFFTRLYLTVDLKYHIECWKIHSRTWNFDFPWISATRQNIIWLSRSLTAAPVYQLRPPFHQTSYPHQKLYYSYTPSTHTFQLLICIKISMFWFNVFIPISRLVGSPLSATSCINSSPDAQNHCDYLYYLVEL